MKKQFRSPNSVLNATFVQPVIMSVLVFLAGFVLSGPAFAINAFSADSTKQSMQKPTTTPVLSDVKLLNAIGVMPLASHESGVGFAELTAAKLKELTLKAHSLNRCGGFEDLTATAEHGLVGTQSVDVKNAFAQFTRRAQIDERFAATERARVSMLSSAIPKPLIAQAMGEVSEANLKATVEFLSSFENRYNRGSTPNLAVDALKGRLDTILKVSKIPSQIEFISHQSTKQKSLRVRLPGATRPGEIIVLGGHLDSINQSWFGSGGAPGADDNASGSANLVEALRILTSKTQNDRTLDFIWYAGEELGLLGSAEIAKSYKDQQADVVAVLQLDMTLHPGDGEFTLGSMTDFTSAWLRGYLVDLNDMYIKAKIINDKCGYGCSDHASWHKQGYPTIMPFEATFSGMNSNIHTARDVINPDSSFQHAAIFSKIALAIALDLGNSTLREK